MSNIPACPPYIVTRISYSCNYSCPGCYHGHKKELKRFFDSRQLFMRLPEFKSIVDEVAQYRIKIGLNSLGEIFLNPDAYDMIRYASQAGVRIEFDTNGSLIDPQALAEAGAADVIFSVDGFSQGTYESYRVGGNLAKVLGKIDTFAHYVRSIGAHTNIYVKYCINAYTEGELDSARKYFESLPGVTFMADCFFPPPEKFMHRIEHPNEEPLDIYEKWRPKTMVGFDLYEPDTVRNVAVNKASTMPFSMACGDIYRSMYIETDGSAYPCCYAFAPRPEDISKVQEELNYGNVFKDGILNTFHGENATRLREAFTKQQGHIPVCATCRANRVNRPIEAVKGDASKQFMTIDEFPG